MRSSSSFIPGILECLLHADTVLDTQDSTVKKTAHCQNLCIAELAFYLGRETNTHRELCKETKAV